MAFSDLPSLFPRAMRWSSKMTIEPQHMIELVVDASMEFLDEKPGPILSMPAESACVDQPRAALTSQRAEGRVRARQGVLPRGVVDAPVATVDHRTAVHVHL